MTAKQKPARSTAIAWRRALKAIGVDLRGVRVMTKRRYGSYILGGRRQRYSTVQYRWMNLSHDDVQLMIDKAEEFVALVQAQGYWDATVVHHPDTRGGGKYPYITITTREPKDVLGIDDVLLATTETEA